jgi:hypothetical protein
MSNHPHEKQDREDTRNQPTVPANVPQRLSARASGPGAGALTAEEVEEAEREAEEWARRVNRC